MESNCTRIKLKRNYTRMKVFFIFYFCFLVIILIPVTIWSFINEEYQRAIICIAISLACIAIPSFLLRYYRNIVVHVGFSDDDVIIETNAKKHILPSKNFKEVIQAHGRGKIFIKYDDGVKKTFVFQTIYSPFRTYSLDIDKMKHNMIHAHFR